MATGQLNGVIDNLRRAAFMSGADRQSDGDLLERFLTHNEEAAFAALVRRHGPMVLGVCRRVLGNAHDAEDAFQAAFMVLVRKANSVQPRAMVGNWLYGVAYRTALKAKSMIAKRHAREKQVRDLPAKEAVDEKVWHDLQPLLDDALQQLADKYRVPVVLCDLEGKSQREAALQLGWPEGTLTTRLTRARALLAKRLTRSGVALSVGALATVLAQNAASAGVPASLAVSTAKAATLVAAGQAATVVLSAPVAALTKGVLQAMFVTKMKSVLAVILTIALFSGGAGWFTHWSLAGKSGAGEPSPIVNPRGDQPAPVVVAEREREPVEPASLAGKIVEVAKDGKTITIEIPPANRGDEPGKQEIKLTAKTEYVFSGVGIGGAKLKAGQIAQIWTDDAKTTAVKLQINGGGSTRSPADITGKLKAISKDGTTLTFELGARGRGEEGKTVDVKITITTALFYSGIAKGGAKPTEGYQADVWLERGSKDSAASISFRGDEAGPFRERGAKGPDSTGKIVGIAKDAKTLTIEMPPQARGEDAIKMNIKLDDKTAIVYMNVGPDGARPTEGYVARVWLAENSKDTAASVILQQIHKDRHTMLTGKVVGIAKDGKGFTVEVPAGARNEEPKKVNIKITEHTRVVYMNVGLNGAQLTEGHRVQVTLDEGSTDAAAHIVFGIGADGRR